MEDSVTPTILVVDDDALIRLVVCTVLIADHYRVVEAATGSHAIEEAKTHHPDLILMDLGLPDMDGLEVIRTLRKVTSIPIIVCSCRGLEQDQETALEAGATDYFVKPFPVEDLRTRLRDLLMNSEPRHSSFSEAAVKLGDLQIDVQSGLVHLKGREVTLAPVELRLLSTLVRHPGRLLSFRFLLEEVWGREQTPDIGTLRTAVTSLRHKIESDPIRPRRILTVQGVGYRMSAN